MNQYPEAACLLSRVALQHAVLKFSSLAAFQAHNLEINNDDAIIKHLRHCGMRYLHRCSGMR